MNEQDREQWIKDYEFKNEWRSKIAYSCPKCHKVIPINAWAEHKEKEHNGE
jgi:hypothetical protein